MNKLRVSVTELDNWQKCRLRHHYRYHERIQPTGAYADDNIALAVGSAVGLALEYSATGASKGECEKVGHRYLAGRDSALTRYYTCLAKLPDWLWELENPVAEDKLEVFYPYRERWGGWGITVVGLPDMWYVEKDEDGTPLGVRILEFKTCADSKSKTASKLLNYQRWGRQPIRYATLLYDTYEWLRDLPFYRQHILVSSNGKGYYYEGAAMRVPQRVIESERAEMLDLAYQSRHESRGDEQATFSPLCGWCDYEELCTLRLMGADITGVKEAKYEEIVKR